MPLVLRKHQWQAEAQGRGQTVRLAPLPAVAVAAGGRGAVAGVVEAVVVHPPHPPRAPSLRLDILPTPGQYTRTLESYTDVPAWFPHSCRHVDLPDSVTLWQYQADSTYWLMALAYGIRTGAALLQVQPCVSLHVRPCLPLSVFPCSAAPRVCPLFLLSCVQVSMPVFLLVFARSFWPAGRRAGSRVDQ